MFAETLKKTEPDSSMYNTAIDIAQGDEEMTKALKSMIFDEVMIKAMAFFETGCACNNCTASIAGRLSKQFDNEECALVEIRSENKEQEAQEVALIQFGWISDEKKGEPPSKLESDTALIRINGDESPEGITELRFIKYKGVIVSAEAKKKRKKANPEGLSLGGGLAGLLRALRD